MTTRPERYHRDHAAARRLRRIAGQIRELARQVEEIKDASPSAAALGIHGKEINGAADTLIDFARGIEALAEGRQPEASEACISSESAL